MKIRDLDKGRYIVVYDMGKSEYSEGMAVVGQVVELEFNEEGKNEAIIESMPFQRYTVTDDNYFDYWNDYMESKTERVGNHKRQSNDLQQRKRNLGFENVKTPNSNKTVRWKDNGILEVWSSYELNIPDYILQDEKTNVINYLNEEIKLKENNDFVEGIIKNYNPIVAYYVGKTIDNLRENEIDNARDLLNKAFKHWE